jgi:glucosamine--fructose-6-phosphate aminotransferase (isomerizing)
VHNGIIENYIELKRELQSQGHTFVTETDTEVVAHLVEREWKDDGLDGAVRRAMTRLRGLFALVLLSADDPQKLVAVRNGPPVVVGLGEGEFFVASDIPAILQYTRNVVFLGDQEMAVVTQAGAVFSDFTGTVIAKTPTRVTWDPIAAEKAGYAHFMLKEIFEQPDAVRDTIRGRVSGDGHVFLGGRSTSSGSRAHEHRPRHHRLRHLVALGARRQVPHRGTGAGARRGRLRVGVPLPQAARRPEDLAIAISQSGETADTLAALREAKQAGAKSLAWCNVVGSASRVTRGATAPSTLHAGPEIGVASTKAFTSQLVALYLLAAPHGPGAWTLTGASSSARPTSPGPAASCRADRAGARARAADRGHRLASTQRAAISSTSAAASTSRSRSKAR